MKPCTPLVVVWLVTFSLCQKAEPASVRTRNATASEQKAVAASPDTDINIGEIEFFGYQSSGLDMRSLRDSLPVHEGQVLAMADFHAIRTKINEAVQRFSGHPTTDVAAVCCDPKGHFMLYIGVDASDTKPPSYSPTPDGSWRLPESALQLDRQASDALMKAVMKGISGEDDSKGYSLSNDADTRKQQLAIREWALNHESLLFDVLSKSSSTEHRQTAAEFLGYARQSQHQIDALAKAANDPDSGARNNAVRALMILAESNAQLAAHIPAGNFVEMLNSGSWTDRNKAGALLMVLSKNRDPKLMTQLRTQALNSLIEMARWRDAGHAISFRILLGRVAGMDETSLQQMADKNDEVEKIVAAAQKSK